MNTNFDGDDIKNPTFSYLDLSIETALWERFKTVAIIELEENIAILQDSYLTQKINNAKKKFYQLAQISKTFYATRSNELLEFRLS